MKGSQDSVIEQLVWSGSEKIVHKWHHSWTEFQTTTGNYFVAQHSKSLGDKCGTIEITQHSDTDSCALQGIIGSGRSGGFDKANISDVFEVISWKSPLKTTTVRDVCEWASKQSKKEYNFVFNNCHDFTFGLQKKFGHPIPKDLDCNKIPDTGGKWERDNYYNGAMRTQTSTKGNGKFYVMQERTTGWDDWGRDRSGTTYHFGGSCSIM